MQIVTYPAEQLKYSPLPIDPDNEVDDGRFNLCVDLVDLMGQWLETMHGKAYGLAATQLGIDLPVCVLFDDEDNVVKLISPQIVEAKGEEVIGVESCFSVPGIWGNCKRLSEVSVRALDALGALVSIEAKGHYAVRLQHEIDHLQGILFIDYCGPGEKRILLDRYKRKMKQMSRRSKL